MSKEGLKQYNKGFGIDELFPLHVTGVVTARDSVVVDFKEQTLVNRMERFTNSEFSDKETRSWLFPNEKNGKYLAGDSRGWKLVDARKKIADNNHNNFIKNFDYRPFDTRKIYYSSDMVDWGREKYMYNIIKGENLNLITARRSTYNHWSLVQVTENMIDNRYHFNPKGTPSQFPLYLYPETNGQQTIEQSGERKPNLKAEIVKQIAENVGLTFTNEKENTKNTFAPIDILDYIYAVLHSPTYREKYKEFLKIDFPRVPYPKDKDTFWQLVKLGGEIRRIHLLESPTVKKYITQYPIDGNNVVGNPKYVPIPKNNETGFLQGNVFINESQYFANVPLIAWKFYIGGYQPAKKWLKDRKDCKLEINDILHYQKIIVALTETDRLMKEIDKIEIE